MFSRCFCLIGPQDFDLADKGIYYIGIIYIIHMKQICFILDSRFKVFIRHINRTILIEQKRIEQKDECSIITPNHRTNQYKASKQFLCRYK